MEEKAALKKGENSDDIFFPLKPFASSCTEPWREKEDWGAER
jgi:hypothetical protein